MKNCQPDEIKESENLEPKPKVPAAYGDKIPAWKRPGIKLDIPGAELSSAISAERDSGH